MTSTIPSRAARKQAELVPGLIGALNAAVAAGRPADRELAGLYRQHREFGSRDRRFFSALVFAWFRWRGWIAPAGEVRPDNCVLAWLLDSDAWHPAIEILAVQTALPIANLAPAGHLTLEAKAEQAGKWLGLPDAPPIAGLVPAWLEPALLTPPDVERSAHLLRCIQAFQTRPPTWLRTRPDKTVPTLETLKRAGFDAAGLDAVPGAIRTPGGGDLESLRARLDFEIQDLAAQCVGLACAPMPGENWWDACAGAGGKSLHLADLMNVTGLPAEAAPAFVPMRFAIGTTAGAGRSAQASQVLATDNREESLAECRRRAQHARLRSIAAKRWEVDSDPCPGREFDGVLVDAPCTGIGTWARNPDARWRVAADAVDRSSAMQLRLLTSVANKVRHGGRLVYAVCTLTEKENPGVALAFLERHPDFTLTPTRHPLTGETTDGMIWIWPWQGDCNGMFIAVMRRSS